MGAKRGLDGKLYYCAAGIGGTPSWTELTNCRDKTLNESKGEADVTTRASGGMKATLATLIDASIEFEMVYDTADTGFTAIQAAYQGNTLIGIAAMDGDITSAGTQGLWFDAMVTQFNVSEPLDGAMIVSVVLKPTYSANAPSRQTI